MNEKKKKLILLPGRVANMKAYTPFRVLGIGTIEWIRTMNKLGYCLRSGKESVIMTV